MQNLFKLSFIIVLLISFITNVYLALHVKTLTTKIKAELTELQSVSLVDIDPINILLADIQAEYKKIADIQAEYKKMDTRISGLENRPAATTIVDNPTIVCLAKNVCGLKVLGKWYLVNDVVDINALTPEKYKIKEVQK